MKSYLTLLSLPSEWTHAFAPITVIECPTCKKTYEMKDSIPGNVKQATVTCGECKDMMEVFLDRCGNMKAKHRPKSTA